ncbi:hypothetical protein F4805DRAFT_137503 [Annulohypoxylon moriforme]|nr:hypothetical protein F4805DRAFT_137503 [Annulohypoxylon moriforme]
MTSAFRKAVSFLGQVIMHLGTLPYYRFFRQNTLYPILSIAENARLRKSDAELSTMLSNWRDRKLYELYFVQVASTLLCAAVIGCFSWEPHESEHWLGPAARYFSLVLSLFAILLSASQSFIFITMNRKQPGHELQATSQTFSSPLKADTAMVCDVKIISKQLPLNQGVTQRNIGREQGGSDMEKGKGMLTGLTVTPDEVEVSIRWNMVFTWQAPIMLLAYSVLAFLVGMTVYACAPLYSEGMPGKEVSFSQFMGTFAS